MDTFRPVIDAVHVSGKQQYLQEEVKSKGWSQIAKELLPEGIKLMTNILSGKDPRETLLHYAKRNHFDLIIHFKRRKNGLSKLFRKSAEEDLITKSSIPVAFYA